MKLKCQCCGIEEDFADSEAAFRAGWDAPPHFTTHICCSLCPAVCVVMGHKHTKAHALWQAQGRPKEFDLETCATDEHFGDTDKTAKITAAMEKINEIIRSRAKDS